MDKLRNARCKALGRNAIEIILVYRNDCQTVSSQSALVLSGRETRRQKAARLIRQKGYFCAEVPSLFDLEYGVYYQVTLGISKSIKFNKLNPCTTQKYCHLFCPRLVEGKKKCFLPILLKVFPSSRCLEMDTHTLFGF